MHIFRFDRAERPITRFASTGATATRVAAGDGPGYVTCLAIAPGGAIGTHPAPVRQLFLVVAGEGWVAGPDGQQVALTAGWGVCWEAGEQHTSGTESGLTALAVEGDGLQLYAPQD
ncbi:cupin domain-containing protein [Streptomyces tateyamensis]|uniref:cupin domain-containing protein n=1 Tax=Streptomyces tateyamensis TaxID=565073 RepID=UPI0015E88C63|nr:cupin domain-containing protein [Streptomyces tateyamensis]